MAPLYGVSRLQQIAPNYPPPYGKVFFPFSADFLFFSPFLILFSFHLLLFINHPFYPTTHTISSFSLPTPVIPPSGVGFCLGRVMLKATLVQHVLIHVAFAKQTSLGERGQLNVQNALYGFIKTALASLQTK